MEIKIKSLALENYKKFDKCSYGFNERTKVSGKNREGKTTLMNAYMEIMTGKEVDGTQPDAIRPHDNCGNDLNRADVVRSVVLDINGTETEIKKITKQKWRKPHGQTEEVLDGNAVAYEIDGFPYAPKKFEEYIKELVNPEILLMCSNPNPFLTTLKKSTADARKLLEKLSGFSIEDFIANNPQYANIADITKGHSVEDTLKKLRKQLDEQKKNLNAKGIELKYEQTRDSGNSIEISSLELAKGEWKDKLTEIDKQETELDGIIKTFDSANTEVLSMKAKLNELAYSAGNDLRKQKSELEQKLADLNMGKRGLANKKSLAELELKHANMAIERHKADLTKARADYKTISKKAFDESVLRGIEAEEFDENAFYCPECGQLRPEEQRNNLKNIFEESKKRRIAEQEKAREIFNAQVKAELDAVTEVGNEASANLKFAQKTKKEAEKQIIGISEEMVANLEEIEKTDALIKNLPGSVDLTNYAEYQELAKQINEKESALATMDNGSEKRMELRRLRSEYMNELSKIDATIRKSVADEEQKERKLAELKAEFDEKKQAVAYIERDIDVLKQFSIEKNNALAEKINGHFHHFKFNFLKFTFEGNPTETCELVCNGTEYNNLNGGDRKLCEVDLCRGLQDMNGLNLPIWIDESNTIDSWRIPMDMEQQLILISRTDDELNVAEIKK